MVVRIGERVGESTKKKFKKQKKTRKWTEEECEESREGKRGVVRGGGEVWQNGPRGTRPPNWYLNTRAKQNCCYHKKLMN